MSVYTLTSQHFRVINGQQGRDVLSLNLEGVVLVFFRVQTCNPSNKLAPIFASLAREESRISFGIVDLTTNNNVLKDSRSTTTPIMAVPHLILYRGGLPYAVFKGERNMPSLKQFIENVLQTFSTPQSFVPMQNQNMYGGAGQPNRNQMRAPETANFPSQARTISQTNPIASSSHPSMKQCDPDDAECFKTPKNVTPYNMPWEVDFHKYIEYGKI